MFFLICERFSLWETYYKSITLQYYIADCVIWVPRLASSDFEQIRLTKALSEQNSFICRGLTIAGLQHSGSELPKLQIWKLSELRWYSIILLQPPVGHRQVSVQLRGTEQGPDSQKVCSLGPSLETGCQSFCPHIFGKLTSLSWDIAAVSSLASLLLPLPLSSLFSSAVTRVPFKRKSDQVTSQP